MLYLLVLFGSFFGICAILGARILLRNHSVRRFVRGMTQRAESAKSKCPAPGEETRAPRPRRDPRMSAIELQKVYTLIRMAEKAEAQREFDRAEGLLIQALTITPGASDVQAQLAKLYLLTSKESKAEALYRDLLQKEDDVSFHANLGLAAFRQGKFAEACTAYKEALRHDPKNPVRHAAVGRACRAAGLLEDAAAALAFASSRLPRDTELLHELAQCCEAIGRNAEAEDAYQRINKLEPYNEEVKEKLVALARE